LTPPSQPVKASEGEFFLDLIAAALSVILTLTLAAHAYIGFFSRYVADDYCTAATVRTAGLLLTQKHFYVSWSGRFSFTLKVSLVELLGTRVVPY
jgi:hypothetical protein